MEKVRLTGGEPLVRRDLADAGRHAGGQPGVRDLTLTTNGVLLPKHAAALAEAGLHRVTISLDADDDETFARMNDARIPVAKVMAGIDAAEAAGLGPIKVNMVVKRGWNEHAVCPWRVGSAERAASCASSSTWTSATRTAGTWTRWSPRTRSWRRCRAEFPLEPMEPTHPGEVAERYRYLDGAGEIGVIASVSRPFCGGCSRARLSADGQLYTCLFATRGHDLRAPLRDGATTRSWRRPAPGLGSRDDRYRSCGRRRDGPAEGRDELHRRLTAGLAPCGQGALSASFVSRHHHGAMSQSRSDAIVFFGATGDLAFKQIFPALAGLIQEEGLDVPVIGVARSGDLASLQRRAAASLDAHGFSDAAAARILHDRLRYVAGSDDDIETFHALRRELGAAAHPLALPRHPAGPFR